ncbi:MAG: DUF2723 domain-containing protein [Rikenellaceae bacterium]|nr:DUF2723 domain-containing protein [Rikenellaceae bacterium]
MNPYKKYNLIFGWLSFAIASLVYLLTMEPSASLWDCAEFIATSYKLEVGHPPGAPLFMMIARIFTLFAPAPQYAAVLVNTMSALASGFTILFLFWSITMLGLKWFGKKGEALTTGQTWAVMGAGLVGALAYTFSDTFWFSAVEAEVYALSSLFTALVFWAMLKWEQVADEPHSNRWLVLIAYLMGLSIGVHLLNLLAFPAMVFIYYFKKNPVITRKGVLAAFGVSVAVVFFVLYIICPWTIQLGSRTDYLFVNSFGLPVNSGMAVYAFLLFALLGWGVWYTYRKSRVILNTCLLMVTVVVLGYSSYASVIIRSAANPPMNSNDPNNPFGLLSLLNRDQYGTRPLISGHSYAVPPISFTEKTNYYIDAEGKYQPYLVIKDMKYPSELSTLFPRLYSTVHEEAYKQWVDITGRRVNYRGEVITIPTFGENMAYFFKYQLNFMYWRYFMWNFVGRQNDIISSGGLTEGNWLSGINFIDEIYLGPQTNLPDEVVNNRARNKYYFLPFILGILGILTQLKKDGRGFTVVMWLFFMTGIAIILYLNQTPGEPRERDYAFAGSFYAYAIWIGLGVLMVYEGLEKKLKNRRLSAAAATVLCLSVPVLMGAQNWDDHTRAHRYVAADFGKNYLETCLPNAIIMNYGDNDTFPLWYNQEVEGVQTDVRVMNMSYLGGEWYIDQMKIKANDSEPVPFTLPQSVYYGRNEGLMVEDITDGQGASIDVIVGWIASENPQTLVQSSYRSGPASSFIPARKILIPVDKENALASGIVRPEDAHLMVDTVEINIQGSSIDRTEMMLLDLLAHFDWNRPLYFTQPHTLRNLGLTDYLQQDGFAYRLVPIKTPYSAFDPGRIDPEYLYDNLMNKFRYGNIKDPRVNCDYFIRYTVNATTVRNTFARLSKELSRQGDTIRAIAVLDRIEEEIPGFQVPHSYPWSISLIEAYYEAGAIAKGNALFTELAETQKQYLAYYLRFPPGKRESLFRQMREHTLILNDMVPLAEAYGQIELVEDLETFFATVGIF